MQEKHASDNIEGQIALEFDAAPPELVPAGRGMLTPAELEKLSAKIVRDAFHTDTPRIVPEEKLTATEKWFDEVGGGHGSETLTQDPPAIHPPKTRHYSTRGGRSYEEPGAREQQLERDSAEAKVPRSSQEIADLLSHTAALRLQDRRRRLANIAPGSPEYHHLVALFRAEDDKAAKKHQPHTGQTA